MLVAMLVVILVVSRRHIHHDAIRDRLASSDGRDGRHEAKGKNGVKASRSGHGLDERDLKQRRGRRSATHWRSARVRRSVGCTGKGEAALIYDFTLPRPSQALAFSRVGPARPLDIQTRCCEETHSLPCPRCTRAP